ncbi:MAG: nucleoside hydrolase [Sphaerochaetaceae bacterium]|nr:nucleoside hydrolase [Sphaerochaetaceae bacterium]
MERFIFDCDPGHDDAVALAMAKGLSEYFKLEAVIATFGNQTREKTLTNALNLVQALELDVPVYEGSTEPLLRERVVAANIHGENGLAGPVFPPCRIKSAGNGIRYALDTVINNPGEITFVSVGPYTDLAVCIKSDPRFAKSLKRIIVMGGSTCGGNVTNTAEFNVYADPEAAKIVFDSGVEIYQFGLDTTLQVMLNEDILNRVRNSEETTYKKIFLASMEYYVKSCKEFIHDYPAMHDPCTIAFLADPSIFEFRKVRVAVDCKSQLNYGATVDLREAENKNVYKAVKADSEKFWNLFFKALERLP